MITFCIYKIISINKGGFYIGSAKSFLHRKRLHIKDLKSGRHHNVYLRSCYKTYGEEDLIFEILESGIEPSRLLEREQFYIDSLNPPYNICRKAGSRLGTHATAETKERLRRANLGIKRRPHSEEIKEKIRNALKGKRHTEERKKNMSLANKGRIKKPLTDQHRQNISKAQKGIKRGKQTDEHIRKRTAYLYGNKFNVGKENRNTPVVKISLDGKILETYKSVKDAAEKNQTTKSNIIHAIKGRTKSAKKCKWGYAKNFIFESKA